MIHAPAKTSTTNRAARTVTMKKLFAASAIAAVALSLSACGGVKDEPTPTPTAEARPVLKVPTTMTGSMASLIVNGGDMEAGSKATVYAYTGGWDAKKITCDDPTAVSQTVTLAGGGTEQTVSFPVKPGITGWVLVAGDFATPCNAEGSLTTVKVAGNIEVLTAKDPAKAGEDRKITVWAKGKPETLPVTADVTVFGPWATIPEAMAADCKTAAVAGGAKVEIKPTSGGSVSDQFGTTFKPEKPGVYRVTAAMPDTDQSSAADTCSADAKPTVFVATGK